MLGASKPHLWGLNQPHLNLISPSPICMWPWQQSMALLRLPGPNENSLVWIPVAIRGLLVYTHVYTHPTCTHCGLKERASRYDLWCCVNGAGVVYIQSFHFVPLLFGGWNKDRSSRSPLSSRWKHCTGWRDDQMKTPHVHVYAYVLSNLRFLIYYAKNWDWSEL